MILRAFFILVLLLFSSTSSARLFDFSMESVAPYLNLRTGMSSMGSDPYFYQTPASYGGDEVGLMYGGDFGVYFRGGGFGVSLGLLVHTHDPVTGATASDGSGNRLLTVDSEGLSYGGIFNIDYQFSQTKAYNWKLTLGGGYEIIKHENTYVYTAAGEALVTGSPTLTESFKTAAAFVNVAIGTEFHLFKTTTMTITGGYHYSLADSWENGQGGQNFAGTQAQGGSALLENGSARNIDWSYPYLQIGFNFYVDTVR